MLNIIFDITEWTLSRKKVFGLVFVILKPIDSLCANVKLCILIYVVRLIVNGT